MTKTTKSERKWGKDVEKKPPKKNNSKDIDEKQQVDMYKILVDRSGFTKAMTYEECNKVIGEMEAKARKLRRLVPSLILVKQ